MIDFRGTHKPVTSGHETGRADQTSGPFVVASPGHALFWSNLGTIPDDDRSSFAIHRSGNSSRSSQDQIVRQTTWRRNGMILPGHLTDGVAKSILLPRFLLRGRVEFQAPRPHSFLATMPVTRKEPASVQILTFPRQNPDTQNLRGFLSNRKGLYSRIWLASQAAYRPCRAILLILLCSRTARTISRIPRIPDCTKNTSALGSVHTARKTRL